MIMKTALSRTTHMIQENQPASSSAEFQVFVYGRMKKGGAAHENLSGARALGEVVTAAQYELVDLGGFPGLVTGGSTAIQGELYAVDGPTLANIDELEDHPETFHRDTVVLEDGREVIGYVLPISQALGFPRVESGAWNSSLVG